MLLSKVICAAAAAALLGTSVTAQAVTVPIDGTRTSTQTEAEDLRGGFLLPIAVLIAAILAIILLTDNEEAPQSP
jgi:hypothetical protein